MRDTYGTSYTVLKNSFGGIDDSHRKSISEAFVNSFDGHLIGYGLGIIILPLSSGWIQSEPYFANAVITVIYAMTSFVRTYFLRRLFEKRGIDDNFIVLGKSMFLKVSERLYK